MTWKIFGHNHVKEILEKQLSLGRTPHAYLFMGAQGLGKYSLAIEFAGKILNSDNALSHPDFMELNVEGEIPVESVRSLIASINLRPLAGLKKVVVINNVEKLNKSGANALLKTLEEPSESTVIILIASERPLPTILSRCQKFNFNPMSQKQSEEFLSSFGAVPKEILELSFGLPGRIKLMSENNEFFLKEKEKFVELENLQKLGVGERLMAVNRFAEMETSELEKMFSSWVMKLFANLKLNRLGAKPLEATCEALKALNYNQNKKLILQNLLLNL